MLQLLLQGIAQADELDPICSGAILILHLASDAFQELSVVLEAETTLALFLHSLEDLDKCRGVVHESLHVLPKNRLDEYPVAQRFERILKLMVQGLVVKRLDSSARASDHVLP